MLSALHIRIGVQNFSSESWVIMTLWLILCFQNLYQPLPYIAGTSSLSNETEWPWWWWCCFPKIDELFLFELRVTKDSMTLDYDSWLMSLSQNDSIWHISACSSFVILQHWLHENLALPLWTQGPFTWWLMTHDSWLMTHDSWLSLAYLRLQKSDHLQKFCMKA